MTPLRLSSERQGVYPILPIHEDMELAPIGGEKREIAPERSPQESQTMEIEQVSVRPNGQNGALEQENEGRRPLPRRSLPLITECASSSKVAVQASTPRPRIVTRIEDMELDLIRRLEDDSLTLEYGTVALGKLNRLYRAANLAVDDRESKRIKSLIDRVEAVVRRQNSASSEVTKRDLQMFESFFTSPPELSIVDQSDQQEYITGDYSCLTKLGTWWVSTYAGEFELCQGFEVSKFNKVERPRDIHFFVKGGDVSHRYDALFFKKVPDQVSFQEALFRPAFYNVSHKLAGCFGMQPSLYSEEVRFRTMMKRQEAKLKLLKGRLDPCYTQWRYCGYGILFAKEQMTSIGLSEEAADQHYGIVFFLNPKPVCEVLN